MNKPNSLTERLDTTKNSQFFQTITNLQKPSNPRTNANNHWLRPIKVTSANVDTADVPFTRTRHFLNRIATNPNSNSAHHNGFRNGNSFACAGMRHAWSLEFDEATKREVIIAWCWRCCICWQLNSHFCKAVVCPFSVKSEIDYVINTGMEPFKLASTNIFVKKFFLLI